MWFCQIIEFGNIYIFMTEFMLIHLYFFHLGNLIHNQIPHFNFTVNPLRIFALCSFRNSQADDIFKGYILLIKCQIMSYKSSYSFVLLLNLPLNFLKWLQQTRGIEPGWSTWWHAGILSQWPGYDSRPGELVEHKKDHLQSAFNQRNFERQA